MSLSHHRRQISPNYSLGEWPNHSVGKTNSNDSELDRTKTGVIENVTEEDGT